MAERTEVIPPIRITPAEKERLRANAEGAGMSVSDFVRARALGAELPAAQATLDDAAPSDGKGLSFVPTGIEGEDAEEGVSDVALPNAIQLSNRTGLPKADCQRMLDRGLVRWRNRPESSDDVLEVNYRGKWQRA